MGSVIIGSGYRGLRFAKILLSMGEEVSAIAEKNENIHNFIRWQLAKEGCPPVPIYTDYRKAFDENPNTDKVFIITPDFTHREIFEDCIKRKYHIFLEKPIATKRNDVADMLTMSEKYDKYIQVGFVLRYTPFYAKIREIISEGLLGKVALIQMNERLSVSKGTGLKKSWHNKWENTGGFFNEKCSHDIDLMLWFRQGSAEPVKIYSYGSTEFGNSPQGHSEKCSACERKNCPFREEKDPLLEEFLSEYPEERVKFADVFKTKDMCFFHTKSEVYDNQSALIIFSDGSHGTFSYVTVSDNPGRDIAVHGTCGCLWGNFDKGYIKYSVYETGEEKEIHFDSTEKHAGGDEKIIRNFLENSAKPNAEINTLCDGAKASLVAFMGDYSMYTGKTENIPSAITKGDFVPFEEYMKK